MSTHVEPVRYGKGSNAIGLLQTVLSDGGGRVPRVLKTLGVALRHPGAAARSLSVHRWSERTVIALVMQTGDSSLVLRTARNRLGQRRLTGAPGPGTPVPQWATPTSGPGWAGLGWAGLGWVGLGWAGLGWGRSTRRSTPCRRARPWSRPAHRVRCGCR